MEQQRIFLHLLLLILTSCYCIVGNAAQPETGSLNTQSCYASTAVSENRKEQIQRNLPGQYVEAKEKYLQYLKDYKSSCTTNSIQSNRIKKRLDICESLLDFIDRKIKESTHNSDSMLLANRAIVDVKLFMEYLSEEFKLLEQSKKSAVLFNIHDFGATGNGVTDDTDAFEKAIVAIRKLDGTPTRLFFPKGSYYFKKTMEGQKFINVLDQRKESNFLIKSQLSIVDIKNLTIEGESQDTEILFGDIMENGVSIIHCRNVTLRNFTLKYKENPYITGVVEKNLPEENAVIIKIDKEGSMLPDDARFTCKPCCSAYTQDGKLIHKAAHFFYGGKYEKLGDHLYKLHIFRFFSPEIKEGTTIVLPCRMEKNTICLMKYTQFCMLENITIKNSPSTGVSNLYSVSDSFVNVDIKPEPGKKISTCADGIHCAMQYFGSYVKNCNFSHMGDDGFNVYGRGGYILKAEGKVLTHEFFGPCRPGDLLQIVSVATGQIIAEGVVKKSVYENGNHIETELEESMPEGISTIESLKTKRYSEKEFADMTRGLTKRRQEPDQVYSPGQSGIGTVIDGMTVHDNRNNAVVIQASSSLVENGYFENMNAIGIRIGSFSSWREGPSPFNVIIRNNKIRNTNYGIYTQACIFNGNSNLPLITGLNIVNNNIANASQPLVFFSSGEIFLKDNQISSDGNYAGNVYSKCIMTATGNTFNGKALEPDNFGNKNWEIYKSSNK